MSFDLKKALEDVPGSFPDFVHLILCKCEMDNDVKEGITAYLQNNPNANTSEVLTETCSLQGMGFLNPVTREFEYKYPQFKYKYDKWLKDNTH